MSSWCRLKTAEPGVSSFLDAVIRAAEGLQVDPKEVGFGSSAVHIQALLDNLLSTAFLLHASFHSVMQCAILAVCISQVHGMLQCGPLSDLGLVQNLKLIASHRQ